MCQAFEPATSTQDKSLSTVGFPTRRGVSPGRRRLVSLSLFYFSVFILFDFFFRHVTLITLLLLLCHFRAAFALCGILLGYFLVWL